MDTTAATMHPAEEYLRNEQNVNTHEKFPHIVIKKGTTFCVVQI